MTSELYLINKYPKIEEWKNLIKNISKYNGFLKSWNLIINFENNQVRFFINTKTILPSTINNLNSFIIKKIDSFKMESNNLSFPLFLGTDNTIFDIYNFCQIKKLGNLKYLVIKFQKIKEEKYLHKTIIFTEKENKQIKTKLLFSFPLNLLNIDFESNKIFHPKGVPKYLDIKKINHLLSKESIGSFLQIDTFPYLEGNYYLSHNSYDFAKHSLMMGSSGSGKSKCLSLLIQNIKKTANPSYKIVMIDPHAAIENDIGALGNIIDFTNIENSINLFASTNNDKIATTELTLELFKSLISDQYNSKLERVLRHAIYLLLADKSFNFNNLKKILLDLEYRNSLIKKVNTLIPFSIIEFFLNDFNDLKTKSYGEAISPLISFIDEMEMIPVFNEENIPFTLLDSINNNFLTLFSLNRTKLGDKVTKTIAGLVMQQLLTLVQEINHKEHIIFIIDEVAVIENPILCRFLSEARKYNLSLFLAGQYFNQISASLKEAIIANVLNYYIFRISRTDASFFVNHLDIKIPLSDTPETKIKLLSTLNNRECIVRISSKNMLLPACKAKTLSCNSMSRTKKETKVTPVSINITETGKTNFKINSNIDLDSILKSTSTNKKIK